MADDCANPLLLGWLKEWWDQARERNSKGALIYRKAYQSMKACPLAFAHPKEALQLSGLGPKLCDRLTEKMNAYCAANGLPMPQLVRAGGGTKRKTDDEASEPENPAKKPKKTKPYVPSLRSGPYALILGLATLDEDTPTGLTKAELIVVAQPHCDSSFTTPSDPTKFYTAWNSMNTLLAKEYVYERGRPIKRYLLTDEGWDVAKRIQTAQNGSLTGNVSVKEKPLARTNLKETESTQSLTISRPHARNFQSHHEVFDLDSSPKSVPEDATSAEENDNADKVFEVDLDFENNADPATTKILPSAVPTFTPVILPPGSFTIRLVLDTREVRTQKDRDYISSQLSSRGLQVLTRALPLGDALWIAQVNKTHAHLLPSEELSEAGIHEIMLSHICERKRLDDLIGSIKDGRFHEQKFRLAKSGVRDVSYIIEAFNVSDENMEKYGDAVESAIASMQVVNGYFVKQTRKLDDTILHLERMTKALQSCYDGSELHIIPSRVLESQTYLRLLESLETPHHITFPSFSALCSKSEAMTLRDVYLKMLMCTRGITGDKAVEVQKIWPTPRALIEAFAARTGDREKDTMVSERLGKLNVLPKKKVAVALSKKVAEIWG